MRYGPTMKMLRLAPKLRDAPRVAAGLPPPHAFVHRIATRRWKRGNE